MRVKSGVEVRVGNLRTQKIGRERWTQVSVLPVTRPSGVARGTVSAPFGGKLGGNHHEEVGCARQLRIT